METRSAPSLRLSRSLTPAPIQSDLFYSPESDSTLTPISPFLGRSLLDFEDDPFATPIFKSMLDKVADFESYISETECWGNTTRTVKAIPPKRWTEKLPGLKSRLAIITMHDPIEHTTGRSRLYRQQSVAKI